MRAVDAERRVAAILPLFNEGPVTAGLVRRMPPEVARTFVCDDGSTDDSPALCEAAGATVLRLEHRGAGAAIRAGIHAAKAAGFWAVVVMAGNGKDDPAEAPRLIARLQAGDDYVQGSRYLPGGTRENLPLMRNLAIRGYSLAFRVMTTFPGTDVTNGFRAYRLALFDDRRVNIDQDWLDRYELEYYIHFKAITLGYKVSEVAVSKSYPKVGPYSKIRPFLDWWSIIRPSLLLWLRIRH